MANRKAARGFTLVELLVSLAFSSVILAGLAAVVIGFTTSHEANTRTRDVVASTRVAQNYIERKLSMAGFGIDPARTFDITANRDSATGPDELAFHARDPAFARRGSLDSSANPTAVTVDRAVTLSRGQILMIVCANGSAHRVVRTTAAASNATTVRVEAHTGMPSTTETFACLSSSAAPLPFVTKVDRFRFFVADVSDGQVVRPYLFLDQGHRVSNAIGSEMRDAAPGDGAATLSAAELADLVPLAANVDDMQVEYVMARPLTGGTAADSDTNWVFGDTSGTAEVPSTAATAPAIGDSYTSAVRFNAHPANIRAVRIALVVRSTKEYAQAVPIPAIGNRATRTPNDKLYRNVSRLEVRAINQTGRSIFAPPHTANNWGG